MSLLAAGKGLALLATQVAVILGVTRGCGWVMARIRQPRVVGEIAGGLLLGPLALGHMLPGLAEKLFPATKLGGLDLISQVGVLFFLFLVGMEVDRETARRNRGATLTITVGSIAVPFCLGLALAPALLERFGLGGGSRLSFALFVGIAMSITALPVLARILADRRGTNRAVDATTASVALICAAGNDLVAWTLLAATLAISHGSGATETITRLALLVTFVAAMLLAGRPAVAKAGQRRTNLWVCLMIVVAFVSARITDALGVHAFFGSFLAGVCAPRTPALMESMECVLQPIVRVALPVFFAMTGLRMQRGLFTEAGWGWLGIVLMVAAAGKIGGGTTAARFGGMEWQKALEIGVLLNTRGLVELVVLNVGYREGILSPALFTIFVLMALVTTAMTVPLMDLLGSRARVSESGR